MTSPECITGLLEDFGAEVAGVLEVVMLSPGGVLLDASSRRSVGEAKDLAALLASLQALANGPARSLHVGELCQIIFRFAGKIMIVSPAGGRGMVAAATSPEADMGLVAKEMAVLCGKVSAHRLASLAISGRTLFSKTVGNTAG
jgi:uncharacterized protein